MALRLSLCALVVGLLASACAAPCAAADDPNAATSSRKAKDAARRAIPWSKLSRQDQRMTQYVVRKTSLYRRTPTHVFECNPEVFNFLAKHPEVVVNVWNLMGVSRMSLARTSEETFHAADQAGAKGVLRVMHSDYGPDCSNKVLVFADGQYTSPPLRNPIKAHCVLLLRSGSRKETNGRTYVTARLDSFIRFEKTSADLIAKTLRPLLVKSADHNFTETMKFVSTFSRTARERPNGLMNLAEKLDKVDPTTRQELASVVRGAAALRTTSRQADSGLRLVRLQAPVAE